MANSEVWASKWGEAGLFLQRRFWKPLSNMMDIFHVLPLAAVAILFVFLATDGQFREIYISYLEGPQGNMIAWVAAIVAAFSAIALISAVLYEAHYALSTMRINVVYSTYSNPDANSRLRSLQRAAAFVLAFLPWFGLTVGLFGARNFVANRYCQLLNVADIPPADLHQMQYLPLAGGVTIAAAVIVLGIAAAYFCAVGDHNRIAQRAVACLAPPLAALLFLLFTDWLNTGQWTWQSTAACLVIAAATVCYFMIYQWLYRRRGGFIFVRAESSTGISLRKRRRRLLAGWAFLPWLFLAAYFAGVQYVMPAAQLSDNWSVCPVAAAALPQPGHWAVFPVAMCCTISIGLLVGHLLGRFSNSKWRRWTICFLVAALAAAVEGVSWFGSVSDMVSIYRFVGPLGTVSLELLFLISTFALLAALSQRSGFPALTLVILAVVIAVIFPSYAGWAVLGLGVVCLVFAAMALLSGRFAVAAIVLLLPVLGFANWHELRTAVVVDQNPAASAGADSLSVKVEFTCWLEQRGIAAAPLTSGQQPIACPGQQKAVAPPPEAGATPQKYPVFIIAAEGGGIYAASAASIFLARLEQVAPQFDAHVFAISGVSGGSIGAAIFQALDHAAHADQPATTGALAGSDNPNCAQPPPADRGRPGRSLTEEAANVMEDDHFSPVVGSIFPEIFGAPLSRSDALVASFEYSAAVQDGLAGRELCAPFSQHWSTVGPAPALVLNSTWVETGFRVAFAPFHLNETDESLYSFSDPSMPNESNKTLMEAAAVSARFPLIMPPFSAVMQDKRWNFVDGAYADNSGATTALDIYRAVKDVAPQSVDLRIILITSSNPQPDLSGKEINGTVFRDTIAPIDALMKVRSDLGNDAVARACSYIYNDAASGAGATAAPKPIKKVNSRGMEVNETCIDHAGGRDAPLQMVEIQDQTYGLSLGWKISKTSFAVVSWMLGEPDDCPGEKRQTSNVPTSQDQTNDTSQQNENAQLTDVILRRNSCVLKSILGLVGNSPAPVPASSPAKPG